LNISGSSNQENNSDFEENEVFKKNLVNSNEESDSIKMKSSFVKKTESSEIDQQLVSSDVLKSETTQEKRSNILNDASICKPENTNQRRLNQKNVSKAIGKKLFKMEVQEYVPLGEKFSKLRKNTERSAKSKSINSSGLKFKDIRRSDRVSNGVSKSSKKDENKPEKNHYSNFISAGLLQDTTECSKSQYNDQSKDESKNVEKPYLVVMAAQFQEEKKAKIKKRSEIYNM